LEALGALTRDQRKGGGASDVLGKYNIISDYGERSLSRSGQCFAA
jgi:hypothetical protein